MLVGLGQHEGELLASDAGGTSMRRLLTSSRRPTACERLVAGVVAEPVVDGLEVVAVGEQQAERCPPRSERASSLSITRWKPRRLSSPVSGSVLAASVSCSDQPPDAFPQADEERLRPRQGPGDQDERRDVLVGASAPLAV